MRELHPIDDERGFTIVEVMVAAVILLVGILGVTTIVNTSNATTTSNKAREQGLALARELIESTRSIRYQALRPGTITSSLQAMPGFADAGGAGWTINRRGIVYTVATGVCSVDDPSDGTGAHVADSFCERSKVMASADTCRSLIGSPAKINGTGGGGLDAGDCGLDTNLDGTVDNLVQGVASGCPSGTSVEAGTCDAQPDDFKRIVVLITWDRGAGSRYVLQQATESFPGLSAYSTITSVKLRGAGDPPPAGYLVKPDAGGTNASSLVFDVTSDPEANQVNWLLGGTDQGPIPGWSGNAGSFIWNLGNNAPASETVPATGEVLDGSYTIGARVQDAGGIHGRELNVTVTLNRRIPFAPPTFYVYADGTGVTGTWSAPPDGDIRAYRMYRRIGSGAPQEICEVPTGLTCKDTTPPSAPNQTYWAVAVDEDPDYPGQLRNGQPSIERTVKTPNSPPLEPMNLTASYSPATGRATLTWKSAGDDALPIQFYRVYRSSSSCTSGLALLDEAQTVLPESSTQTYFETPATGQHYYYAVSAVDSNGAEGPKTTVCGQVTT